ncbi:hypothetical protein EYF80_066635 [Liparis tanakae]|uniref:Uncharacterized protein n=1 Tax=Liparis tanakae TaxID=230148 RepID=A0A4Z2E3B4_9TELE|nr:hypothetical protein EYF80_066635 [Liparis tanakae]
MCIHAGGLYKPALFVAAARLYLLVQCTRRETNATRKKLKRKKSSLFICSSVAFPLLADGQLESGLDTDETTTTAHHPCRVYLRFSGVKARFRSVSTYLLHFSTAFGLVMNGVVSTRFLWISAPFFIHRFTSVTPDISLPCVPPKIATRLASVTRALLPPDVDMVLDPEAARSPGGDALLLAVRAESKLFCRSLAAALLKCCVAARLRNVPAGISPRA